MMKTSKAILKYWNVKRQVAWWPMLWLPVMMLLPNGLSAKVMIMNGLSHERDAMPGQAYREMIEIHNGSDKAENVVIYQRDYRFLHTGESHFDEPGSLPRSNAGWIALGQTNIMMQPSETMVVPLQVTVPGDETLSGTYWSVVMVEKVVPPDPDRPRGLQIRSVVRYAIQVITHVGSGGERDMRFLGTEYSVEEGQLFLNVMMENTGEQMLRHVVAVELYDEQGNQTGTYSGDVTRTFPGTSVQSMIELAGVKPGSYNALLVADCENNDIFATNIRLQVPDPLKMNEQVAVPDRIEEPAKEPDIPKVETPAQGMQWGIQVAFLQLGNRPNASSYSKLGKVIICSCANGYRVLAAMSEDRSKMEAELRRVVNAGYKDAWINRIDLSQCDCR